MARQRLTWNAQAGNKNKKLASPPPQIPAVDRTEGPDHPAYYPDPETDQYESGDTSSWAEDPHPGPYPVSPPPAMPGNDTTETPDHPATISQKPRMPATGPRAPKSASFELRAAAERKASLCVRIAQALMPKASVAKIERKAMLLMDEDERKLLATAEILNITAGEEDEEEVEVEEEVVSSKKASRRIASLERELRILKQAFGDFFGMDDDMAMGMDDMDMMDDEAELDMMLDDEDDDLSDGELMAMLHNMADDMDGDGIDQNDAEYGYMAMDDDMMAMDDEFMADDMDDEMAMDEEEMLAALMAEMEDGEAHMASDAEDAVDPLAKGPGVQSGEGGNVDPEPAPHTPVVEQMDGSEKTALEDPSENDIAMATGADPMGLMDEMDNEKSANDDLLALYADLDLPKTASDDDDEDDEDDDSDEDDEDDEDDDSDDDSDDEDVEVEEDEEEVTSSKKASRQRPQLKKANKGPKSLGSVPGLSKKAQDEVAELSQIWDTAPDVREFFGMK